VSEAGPEAKGVENPPAVIEPAARGNSGQEELFPAAAFLQIERQRIDSYNRRTEVASQAVAANNEADKRQFDFQMAKLSSEDAASKRKDSLAQVVVIGLGLFGIAVIALFLVMAFFGSPAQSAIALQILKVLGVGSGGYGVISGLTGLIKRLMQNK
jgi:hypothetical protein